MDANLAILLIGDLPAHPLITHGVVVLLPLAALGGIVIAAMPSMRRRFGVAVLLLTIVGVGLVPLATRTGEELESVLPPNQPLIEAHQARGEDVLPFALAFGITVVLLLIAGRLADRERTAASTAVTTPEGASTAPAASGAEPDAERRATSTATIAAAPRTWRRIALVAAALVAVSATAVTVQVVRTGHSGSTAVWNGVGSP